MAKKHFRLLYASEIDVRVATVKKTGCSLLLYKDARVDQNILDETFGIFGWQRTHELIGDRLYCTVSVKDEKTGEWISKQDVGTESNSEKEKGQASDSFKRACFNWGIGRELYTSPFIWVNTSDALIEDGQVKGKFIVKSIGYDADGNINALEIQETKTKKVVYKLGTTASEPAKEVGKELIGKVKVAALDETLKKEGIALDTIYKLYKVKDLKELTEEKHANILAHLKDLKAKQ